MVGRDDGERVRAWIRRPGLMRVEYIEPSSRPPYVVDERDDLRRGRAAMSVVLDPEAVPDPGAVPGVAPRRGEEIGRYVPLPQPEQEAPQGSGLPQPAEFPASLDPGAPQAEFPDPRDRQAPQPLRRPDGLVERRPDDSIGDDDDPMHQNYYWVAMLDPVELADGADLDDEPPATGERPTGVEILELQEADRLGRPTLIATVRPASAYDPRCSCCPLLFNDVTVAILREEGGPLPDPLPKFADAHRVALDRQTGICVSIHDVGGDADGEGFDVVIEEVDVDYPDAMLR